MANASDIKLRIQSISDTKKVTDAMFMISSVKMRRAKREAMKVNPYFEELKKIIGELAAVIPDNDNRYFRTQTQDDKAAPKHGVLVISSDKGLSGGYNRAVTSIIDDELRAYPDTVFFVIGDYGRQYLAEKGIPFAEDFCYQAELASMTEARKICTDLLDYYDSGRLDEISIIYTDFKSGRMGECREYCLLPLEKSRFCVPEHTETDVGMEFYPDPASVLNGIIPNFLTGYIYGSLIDSYCSEQEARMTMMSTAGKNADEMIRKLKLRYNTVRQAAITREMTEITSGARAQKAKMSEKRMQNYE